MGHSEHYKSAEPSHSALDLVRWNHLENVPIILYDQGNRGQSTQQSY